MVDLFKTNNISHPPPFKNFKDEKVYKKLNHTKEGKIYLKTIIYAFINFKNYLKDDTIDIDYEFLWDIICIPNENLFPHGLNLIILTIPDNDITQNVGVICPSNHYSSRLFDGRKSTAVILLRDNFYEPILKRQKIVKGRDRIQTVFALMGPGGEEFPWSLQHIIRKISSLTKNKCHFLPSRKNTFFGPDKRNKFLMKQSVTLKQIMRQLKHTVYKMKFQIVNMHTKTIGVVVSNGSNRVMIPCSPSPVRVNTNWQLINQSTDWWEDYHTTVEILNSISELERASPKIPCKPIFKVVDDGMIIGVITNTDQFVPVEPEEVENTLEDGLIEYHLNYDPLNANMSIWNSEKQDKKRLEIVQRIKLETNFYNTFRNMTRILLNQYEFKTMRNELEEAIGQQDISYWEKLENIVIILKNLLSPFVHFVKYNKKSIQKLSQIRNCLNMSKEKCEESSFCLSAAEGKCKLILPKFHLLSAKKKHSNINIYYGRLADEFIRYGRIRDFILKPNKFISFQEIGYNLRDDELLLLETTLVEDKGNYFSNLIPIIKNKFIKFPQTFYSAKPQQSISYPNKPYLLT